MSIIGYSGDGPVDNTKNEDSTVVSEIPVSSKYEPHGGYTRPTLEELNWAFREYGAFTRIPDGLIRDWLEAREQERERWAEKDGKKS